MKRILIAGASGMIGNLVLQNAIKSSEVSEINSLVRKKSNAKNPKVTEVLIEDFRDYSKHIEYFKNIDAGYFCIGAYTGQVKDDIFKLITVDFAIAFGSALEENSPNAKLCLLSGQGADRTEKSRASFAKYKGMAENALATMNIQFHSFRPAYIYPVEKRKEPNVMYSISRVLYPLIKKFGKNASIPSTKLAKAMFLIGLQGGNQEVYENKEILKILEK